MAGEEDVKLSSSNSQLTQTQSISNHEMEHSDSQVNELQESGEDSKKELAVLLWRVKTTAALLTDLKSKARILTNQAGTPMPSWSRNTDFSSFECPKVEKLIRIENPHGGLDEKDEIYMGEVVKSVEMIAEAMESLVKRVLVAESEIANEKQKATLGQEEIKNKEIQIESMSEKLEEMDRFAADTNRILNEMRQWVEDLVEETSRQRQRATENEEELIRVKRDFESLKSYVSSLISVRETLVSSEKQFQNLEKLFERLVVKTTQLETEKTQKEAEVQKLMDDNMKLNALLDKKEAQLLAMNEQCKLMALSASHI